VVTPSVSGPQQAAIGFEIDSGLLDEGHFQGDIEVSANGGQRLTLRVHVEVRKPRQPFTRRLFRPFFTGVLLLFLCRLLLGVPLDLYARWLGAEPGGAVPAGSFAAWLLPSPVEPALVRFFVLATWWLGAVGGVLLLWRHGSRWSDGFFGAVAGSGAGIIA